MMWTFFLLLLPSLSLCAPPFSRELKHCDASGPRVSELSLNSALSTFLCFTEEEIGAMEEVDKKRKLAQTIAPLIRYEHSHEDLVEKIIKIPSDSLVKTVNIVMNRKDVKTDLKTIEEYHFVINELMETNVDSDLDNPKFLSLVNNDMEEVGRNGRVALLGNFLQWIKLQSDGSGSPNTAKPQILTSSRTFRVSIGDSVILPCDVHDLSTLVPLWKHKEHVLTAGKQMVNPDVNKYQLVSGYNLQIRNIRAFDAGDYICYITTFGQPITLTHTIEVIDRGLTSGCGSSDVSCQPTGQYRRMDGMCNNLQQKEKGAAGTSFSRFITNAYEDGLFNPRGGFYPSSLPNPRFVSVNLHHGDNVLSKKGITHMTMQFGQFLGHDITHTLQEKMDCCNIRDQNSPSQKRCFNIDVSSDPFYSSKEVSCQPFTRSDFSCSTKSEVRNQVNGVTAFIDASQVYGSSDEYGKKLRTLTDGLLKINSDKVNPSLPTRQQCGFSSVGDQKPSDLVVGDMRKMNQPALAAIHTLFMNEHNRIAKELKSRLTGFFQGKTNAQKDDFLFQESRKILIGEIQNIVYTEYLPVILGEEKVLTNQLKLQASSSYDPTIDPSIKNEFATAAFRFGHTLISGTFKPEGPGATPWSLRHNYFKFEDLVLSQNGNGWKNEMRGAIRQTCPAADLYATEDITNFLFVNSFADKPYLFGEDLEARNIQRGRDHGIPCYNKLRSICGLSNIESFASRPDEISTEIWDKLQTVYSSVDDIDGYTGGLAETTISDGLVGPTFACIIAKQFNHLLYGDRFFFTHTESPHVKGLKSKSKAAVLGRTLGDILCDNADISETQANVFKDISASNTELSCSSRKGLNFNDIASEISS